MFSLRRPNEREATLRPRPAAIYEVAVGLDLTLSVRTCPWGTPSWVFHLMAPSHEDRPVERTQCVSNRIDIRIVCSPGDISEQGLAIPALGRPRSDLNLKPPVPA